MSERSHRPIPKATAAPLLLNCEIGWPAPKDSRVEDSLFRRNSEKTTKIRTIGMKAEIPNMRIGKIPPPVIRIGNMPRKNIAMTTIAITHTAVSYTHLDVYKRQRIRR